MESFVSVIDGALSHELCAELIANFDARASHQTPGTTGAGVDPTKKRSLDILLDRFPDWRPLQSRVAEVAFRCLCEYAMRHHFLLVGALSPTVRHPATGEPVTLDDKNFSEIGARYVPALLARCFRQGAMNMQRYETIEGGYPHWHSEIFPERGSIAALQRVLFWICYLNDVECGGETEFVYQKMKVQPRRGRMVIAPAGFTHTHRGNAPASGPKYILTSWLLYSLET
jgi:hypothetical protein